MQKIDKYDLWLPEGTDDVKVEDLNHNMEQIESIFNDIYNKLPTPPQPVTEWTVDLSDGTVEADGYTYGVIEPNVGLQLGESYDVTFTPKNQDPITISCPVIGGGGSGTGYYQGYLVLDMDTQGTHVGTVVQDGITAYDGSHESATAQEGVTSYVFRAQQSAVEPEITIVKKLPLDIINEGFTEIEIESDAYLAYLNRDSKLGLRSGNNYTISIVVGEDSYSYSGTASSQDNIVTLSIDSFSHPSLPEQLTGIIATIELYDGVRALPSGDMEFGNYSFMSIGFNSGHRLSEISAIDKYVITSAES